MNSEFLKKYAAKIIFGVIALSIFVVPLGFAQTSSLEEEVQIDRSELVELYEDFLASEPKDPRIEALIEEERGALRDLIETDIWESINASVEENLREDADSIEKQRDIIEALEKRLEDQTADLELLLQEEQDTYFFEGRLIPGVKDDEGIRTRYADILGKKAILEERIDVMKSLISVQQDKLDALRGQQFEKQLKNFLVFGKYIVIFLLLLGIQKLVGKFIISRISHLHQRYAVSKIFNTFLYTIFILWILTQVFAENPNFIASFAIVGAGLVVALQDVVKDIVGWLMVLQGRFSVGDRIFINGVTGDVVDVGVLRTTLLEVGKPGGSTDGQRLGSSEAGHTGKVLFMPNSSFLLYPVTNYNRTSDYLKTEVKLQITFESDWKKAKEILENILEEETGEYSQRERHQYRRRTSQFYTASESKGCLVYMNIADSGLEFILRFDAPVRGRRGAITRVTESILTQFGKEPSVDLAYNTLRVVTPE